MTFGYSDPEISAVERLLSVERLSRYTALAGGDRAEALRLYERNTRLSEAFYTPLQGLEVCLRNSLSLELMGLFGSIWHDNAHNTFQHPLTEMINSAEQNLQQDGKTPTVGRVIAELNFGFWVTLLSPRYETSLWRPALRKGFPNRPRGTERKGIHSGLNALRRLRNRVAHHEPIMHRNLAHDHDLILQIVGWVCPDTAAWIGHQSQVPALLP